MVQKENVNPYALCEVRRAGANRPNVGLTAFAARTYIYENDKCIVRIFVMAGES